MAPGLDINLQSVLSVLLAMTTMRLDGHLYLYNVPRRDARRNGGEAIAASGIDYCRVSQGS